MNNHSDAELLEQMQENLIPANHTTDFDVNVGLDEHTEDRGTQIDFDQNYVGPVKKDALIGSNGAVLDYKDVSPFEVIKKFAEKQNVKLNDPKKSCKHCYGRGYIGRMSNSGAPVPCNCIYPANVRNLQTNFIVENRSVRRNPKYKKEKAIKERLQLLEQLKLEKKIEAEYQEHAGIIPAVDAHVSSQREVQN